MTVDELIELCEHAIKHPHDPAERNEWAEEQLRYIAAIRDDPVALKKHMDEFNAGLKELAEMVERKTSEMRIRKKTL
jgi:hypothetical protein